LVVIALGTRRNTLGDEDRFRVSEVVSSVLPGAVALIYPSEVAKELFTAHGW